MNKHDGFTLLEMLISIALLASVATMMLPYIAERSPRDSVLNTADDIAHVFQHAQAIALAQNKVVTVRIDMRGRTVRSDASASELELPKNLALTTVAARQDNRTPIASFLFLPTGETSGGTVTLQHDRATARIAVHWLTGAIETSVQP